MSVHFSSASDEWSTPDDLFKKYDAIFHFTLDVCATQENTKCKRYFTKEQDGLTQKWDGIVWCNPPYGREIGSWIKKAYESSLMGTTVVCLIPSRTDTRWFHNYILPFSQPQHINLEHIWAAGIFDGEGCVYIRKNNPTEISRHKSIMYTLGLKISMTDKETIDKLYNIFKVGHINFQDRSMKKNHKSIYNWTCYTSDAIEVIKYIYHYCITKKHELFEAINYSLLESGKRGQGLVLPELQQEREYYYNLLRNLKKEKSNHCMVKTHIEFLKGRLKFGGHKNSAPFPSAVVTFRPPIKATGGDLVEGFIDN